jgi:mannose-6-phosphate isomerase-like protein (cupin superfamily)
MGRFRIAYAPAPIPGAKRQTEIEQVTSAGDKTLTSADLLKGAINRVVSGQRRDIISFTNVDTLARDLGMSVGDSFDFKFFVDNPNRGQHLLTLPDARSVSGLDYYGDLRGLTATVPKCYHEIEFFYVESGKMAVTIRTIQLAPVGK